MRILLVGDIHIKRDNSFMINLFRNELIKHLKSTAYDKIIFMGDILHYHEKIYIQCMETAIDLFRVVSQFAPLYILVGNHDMTADLQSHWMTNLTLDRVTIIDKPTAIGTILMCPYTHAGNFWNMIEQYGVELSTITTILAHQEFAGAKMGAFYSTAGDTIDKLMPHQTIFSGHVHERQTIGDGRIRYIGSALQHGFGDDDRKIIAVVSVPDNSMEPISLDLPARKIIRVRDISTLTQNLIDTKDYYKIIVSCSSTDWGQFKKTPLYRRLTSNTQVTLCHDVVLLNTNTTMRHTQETDRRSFIEEINNRLDNPKLTDMFRSILT